MRNSKCNLMHHIRVDNRNYVYRCQRRDLHATHIEPNREHAWIYVRGIPETVEYREGAI